MATQQANLRTGAILRSPEWFIIVFVGRAVWHRDSGGPCITANSQVFRQVVNFTTMTPKEGS
jgi:hypothetical protein